MKSALEHCQQHHRNIGLGQELNPTMFNMVTSTSLFKDIDARFKSMGLTNFGGLAWLSSQVVGKTLEQIEQGEDISDSIYELAEKMATIALLLGNSIHSLKLTKLDMDAIFNSGDIAIKWLDKTS
ncbi:hypothetical protein [Moritella viscosa]|nr:hypothetical protein [Moritella viscosa]